MFAFFLILYRFQGSYSAQFAHAERVASILQHSFFVNTFFRDIFYLLGSPFSNRRTLSNILSLFIRDFCVCIHQTSDVYVESSWSFRTFIVSNFLRFSCYPLHFISLLRGWLFLKHKACHAIYRLIPGRVKWNLRFVTASRASRCIRDSLWLNRLADRFFSHSAFAASARWLRISMLVIKRLFLRFKRKHATARCTFKRQFIIHIMYPSLILHNLSVLFATSRRKQDSSFSWRIYSPVIPSIRGDGNVCRWLR